jgi:diguanylate cyclase (GGDEF)-like protein/PAS domain S-box-containing protein
VSANFKGAEKKVYEEWQSFIEPLNNPILIISNDCQVLQANKAATSYFKQSRGNTIGSYFSIILYGTNTPPIDCPVEKTLKTKKREIIEHYLEDRKTWMRINAYPFFKTKKEIDRIVCIIEDLTENKQAEKDRKSIEDKFQLVFENIYDVIMLFDAKGNIQEVSPSFLQMTGYESSEMVGKNFKEIDILTPESKQALIKSIHHVLEGNRIRMVEYDFIDKNGDIRNCEVSSSPILQDNKVTGIICVSRNVTKRKQTEAALKESEEKYKALVENPLIGILIIQDGKFVYVNDRVAEMHGYTPEELLNSSTLAMLHPDYRDAAVKRAIRVGKGESLPGIVEQKRQKKDGEVFWAATIITPIIYQGKPAIAETIVDITAAKTAQEEIKQARDKLAEAIGKLERRNYETGIISEMRDMMQVAADMNELPPIIKSNMEKLFPGAGGALFLMDPTKSELETVGRWNDFPEDIDDNIFAPDACWALRRSNVYIVEDTDIDSICPHLKHPPSNIYACIPVMDKGEIIGLLHIRDHKSMSPDDRQKLLTILKETSNSISEYLSLSMANLRLTETLKYQSIKDPLTALYNRRFLMESFTKEIVRASRKKTKITIVMIDIDHFKKFNDKWGHAAGDELLMQLGKFFRENIRESDIACRYGGEEFVILMPESDAEVTFKRAEKMRSEVKNIKAFIGSHRLPPIALSMGISEYPTNGENVDDLLRIADDAMYKAKQEGRDRVVVA